MIDEIAQIRYFSEYFHYIVGLLDRSQIFFSRAALGRRLRREAAGIQEGWVFAPFSGRFPDESSVLFDERNGLILMDGSFLRFIEEVKVSRRTGAEVFNYSYHYQRPSENFFFRFDFEKEPTAEPIRKVVYEVNH
jgi:hypothetical protein